MFIPIGYDSMAKIKIDFDSQTLTKEFDGPFEGEIFFSIFGNSQNFKKL